MISEGEIVELYRSILSIRNSLDFPFRAARMRDEAYQEAYKNIALKVEAIRLDFSFPRRTRGEHPVEVIHKARTNLRLLLEDPAFDEIAGHLRFRPSPPHREGLSSELNNENLSVVEAGHILFRRVEEIIRGNAPSETANTVASLRKVVPEQRLAPAMFNIVHGKIVLVKQPAEAHAEDAINAQRARDALVERGRGIVEALEKSNCDRRILESLKELQEELQHPDNVIELGLMNIGVESICKGASEELPEAILGAIEGHTAGIGMYVAQFPAWQRFSENAASVELDVSDITQIGEAAHAVIERLVAQPEIADEEVPKTLKALRLLINNPRLATKRAAFAVLRTIENLVAKIYQYGATFLDETVAKTVDGLSGATSKIIVGGLMAVALAATANLGGITSKVAETAWMKTAAEIVKKQIEQVAK